MIEILLWLTGLAALIGGPLLLLRRWTHLGVLGAIVVELILVVGVPVWFLLAIARLIQVLWRAIA